MKLNDKVITVTGAGGGVGRQLVLQLLEKGASVAAVDINWDSLEETKKAVGFRGKKVSIHAADITDKNRVKQLAAEIYDIYGRIDGLINNAGIIQPFITLADLEEGHVDRLMNINFYGMMNMVRAFLPYLAESPEAHIANVSSMGGFLPVPGQSVYGASKAAVKTATEGLRIELSNTQIGVSLVIPGGIETDIKKNSGLENPEISEEDKKNAGIQLTKPADAAAVILKGIENNKAKILVGKDAKIMDFLYRLAPQKAAGMISRVMAANHGGIFNISEELKTNKNKAAV